jgi:MFS superfamily sulfate permease-like transporter
MKMPRLLLLNNCALFLFCSVYLGTGVSLVFFQFPLESKLTVDNYYLPFVEPVTLATHFFTYMTILMLICAAIMLATEWFSGRKWPPLIVIAAVVAATVLTVYWILPLNARLAAGIKDAAQLKAIFHEWANLNRVRVLLWAIQWSAMMYYFYALAFTARADR